MQHIIANDNGLYLRDSAKPEWIDDPKRATRYPDHFKANDRLETLFALGTLNQDSMDAAAVPYGGDTPPDTTMSHTPTDESIPPDPTPSDTPSTDEFHRRWLQGFGGYPEYARTLERALRKFMAVTAQSDEGITQMATIEGRIAFYERLRVVRVNTHQALSDETEAEDATSASPEAATMSHAMPALVHKLVFAHEAWVVGPAAAPDCDHAATSYYAVIVPMAHWRSAALLIPPDAKPNTFGAWKCQSEGREVDVWPGDLSVLLTTYRTKWVWHPRTGVRWSVRYNYPPPEAD